jgi:GGDEF domain-containing protein
VDKPESAAQADIIARKISAELAKPYVFHVRHEGAAATTIEHRCTASIGVVLFGKDDAGQDDILKWADTAMYQAKESGSGLIRYYDPRA